MARRRDPAEFVFVERMELGGSDPSVAIKDSIDIAGFATRMGSKCLADAPRATEHAAGMRIEPPVSLPSAKSTRPAATATAEPLDDPPGTRPGARGLMGVPQERLMPLTP